VEPAAWQRLHVLSLQTLPLLGLRPGHKSSTPCGVAQTSGGGEERTAEGVD